MTKPNRTNGCMSAIRRFFLSAVVIISFIAYALEKKVGVAVTGEAAPTLAIQSPVPTSAVTATPPPPNVTATATPVVANAVVAPTTTSGYKDGTYTGPSVFINWGFIQVQAIIQGGKISNVQFLEYPTERRTSARINSIAVPELQQEAVQAQSANVNIITGATLTSEGFAQSLQFALDQARS